MYTDLAEASRFTATEILTLDSSGVDIHIQSITGQMVMAYTSTYNPSSPVLKFRLDLHHNELWMTYVPRTLAFFNSPYVLTPHGTDHADHGSSH